MLQPAWALLGAVLMSLVPAQSKQAASAVANAGFGITSGADACEHLSREECCGQMLEIAGFEAHGDQLPRLVKNTVRLACMDQSSEVTPQMCRSILMTRGIDAKEAKRACTASRARGQCRKDGHCKQCTTELSRLDYKGAHNACYAVTYATDPPDRVVRIGAADASGEGITITRRRRVQ